MPDEVPLTSTPLSTAERDRATPGANKKRRSRQPRIDSDDPWQEAVGDSEPCDWCGRPGIVEQFTLYLGDEVLYRNPALCDVCSYWFNVPGEVTDAMDEAGLDYDAIHDQFEDCLRRRWQEKVRRGQRSSAGFPQET